jgi:ATP-dependent helicase/nuclease subunit B
MILAKRKYNTVDPDELINRKINSGKIASLLILVPTNRKSRSLKKEFIKLSGGKVTGKINIDTLGTFCQKVYSSLNLPPMQFLSEAASAVLIKKCFRSADLRYFNRYKSEVPSGTLTRIKNIISEYKRHGISPGHLISEARKLEGSEKLKAEDIAQIYTFYNEECLRSSSGEIGDIYSGMLKSSQQGFSRAFINEYPEADLVIINGFDEFTAPEVNLINMISPEGDPELFLIFDYFDKNPGVFRHLKDCYERFTSKGFYIVENSSVIKDNTFRDVIRSEYFSGVTPKDKIKYDITELIALNREKEVELIAKEIKEILSRGDTKPDKICVAFNLIQNYSPFIRDKFPLFDLPFNLTDRFPLNSAGPITALISFLEIAGNDFYYKSIFRAVSSGFINLKDVSLSDLMISSSELKIISGCDNWIVTIEEALRFADKKKYHHYRNALDSIRIIKDLLEPLQSDMNISGFRKNLFELIDLLNIPRNILLFNEDTEIFFKALSSFYDTLSELFTLLGKEFGVKQRFPLSFFLDNIRTAVENTRFNVSEKSGYGIQVTNLNEIRGLSFDYLFIGGLMDGELPTRYTPEIFFSGSYVREEWKHQVEERYRFYQSLCTWSKGLFLVRSLQDDNKELAESNFLSELKTHFLLQEKTEKDYAGTIYSKEELQIYAGRNIHNDFVKNLTGIDIENIHNLLKTYKSRTTADYESEYSGYIARSIPQSKRDILKKSAEKEFSASQLEIYASCPFRYFLERVLYLNVTEEPSEDMEFQELGTLLHKILFLFYKNIKEKNLVIFNSTDEEFKKAEDIIFRIAEEVIDGSASKSPLNFLEIERLKGLRGDRKKSVLYTFLKKEREHNDGYTPYDFEVPFGNMESEEGRRPNVTEFHTGPVKVRGKIDRIDIDEKRGKVKVIDYKLSGKKIPAEDLERGLSLQLPLYLYAAKQILEAEQNKEYYPAGADIYSLKYQKKHFGRKPIISQKNISEEKLLEEYERLISICRKNIENYAKGISEGIFNLSKLEDRAVKACLYCNFKSICRIDEID